MMRYSVQPKDRIFVKGYRFLSFTKNMSNNICNNISKNLSSKYSQKLFDHAKQSATDALKNASKKVIQKTAEETGDLIGNKIAYAVAQLYGNKITKSSRNSPQNNSEMVINEAENIALDREIQKERYTSPEKNRKLLKM